MTTPSTAVTVTPSQYLTSRPGEWSDEESRLIASSIAPGLDQTSMVAFAAICQHADLDPFKRQIYAWKDRNKLTIHVAINGWRAIAARTGEYAGQVGPEWCGPDGQWRDVWLEDKTPPAACRVGIIRRGFSQPIYSTVTWKEFGRGLDTWRSMPAHMLSIRAEAHALQRAFPEAYEQISAIAGGVRASVGNDNEARAQLASRGVDVETGEVVDASPMQAPEAATPASGEVPGAAAGSAEPSAAPGAPKPSFEDLVMETMAELDIRPIDVANAIGEAFDFEAIKDYCRRTDTKPRALFERIAAELHPAPAA